MSTKYVFCINSGRSGSEYLSSLLSTARNAVSVHEDFPVMNGEPMRQYNAGHRAGLDALMRTKVRQIQRQSRRGRRVYCETNPSFVLGWGYLLPDAYLPQREIGVVLLRRDPDATARSMQRVRTVPGASSWARTWYLIPGAPGNLTTPDDDSPLGLCRWHVDEVRRRELDYCQRFPAIRYWETSLELLNDYSHVAEMFRYFGLRHGSALEARCGRIQNTKAEWPNLTPAALQDQSRYPSADDLAPRERDRLIGECVRFLLDRCGPQIERVPGDLAIGGTRATGLMRVVAENEVALAALVGHALTNTETEVILVMELLRSVDPADPGFFVARRSGPPGVAYQFDFNVVPTVRAVVGTLGWRAVASIARPVMRRRWRSDYSHRADAP